MDPVMIKRTTFVQALADFAAKVHELTQSAVDGRKYVLVETLRSWMRHTSPTKLDDKFVTNTDLLSHAAYFGKRDFRPIESSRISDRGNDCCIIVFSILLDLGLGYLIDSFSRKGIIDRRLPEDLSSLKEKLRDLEDGVQIAELFNDRQWKFCPATFSQHMENDFFKDVIIPICRQSEPNSGGTAKVRQIVVQEQFVGESLRNLLKDDPSTSYDDQNFGPVSLYVLAIILNPGHLDIPQSTG
jgi:hypothetical protein